MKKDESNKTIYEQPIIEIVTFELEDSIAVSGQSVSGLICGEEMQ
jgi:hypothetical protein